MKTVFQRTLSVILCVILVVCTMSIMAYAATDFTYDRLKDGTSKSITMNIDPVLDMLDEALADMDVHEVIDLGILGDIEIDIRSIDRICATIDDNRTIINLASNLLGDLRDLDLSVFEKGLSRAEDGDVKVLKEFLELASANGEIVGKLVAGTLDLGSIGDALGLDLTTLFGEDGVSGLVTGLLVSLVHPEGSAEYNAAYAKALTNLDAFIYEDVMDEFVSSEGGILEGLTFTNESTVNELLINIFSLVVDQYLISLLEGFNVDLSTVTPENGADLTALASILVLDSSKYDYSNIRFTPGTPILDQVNNVLGEIVRQVTPDYDWEEGAYTKIGANIEGLFRYIAVGSGLIEGAADMTFDQLVVNVFKTVLDLVDFGDLEIYSQGVESCTTTEQVITKLFANIANYGMGLEADYSGADYETILGDILIDFAGGELLIADPAKDVCEVGEGYKVWDVANYILNFFLVNKEYNVLLGRCTKNITASSSVFDKLDCIFDMFASDGTATFDSEEFLKTLIDSVFNLDLQTLINCTVKRASDYINVKLSDPSLVQFLYTTVYNFTKNIADGKDVLPAYQVTKPFTKAVSNEGIAQIIKSLLGAFSTRPQAVASLLGQLLGLDSVSVSVSSVANPIYTGTIITPKAIVYGNGQLLEQNVDYKVVLADSKVGSTTASVIGIGAYEGQITSIPVTVVLANVSGLAAKPASASSVALSWNKVAGATSYNIYNGSTLVKNVTTNSYTVTGLKAATRYTFKVEAVNGTVKSGASVNTVTLPAQVTNLKAAASSTTAVKLTWNASAGAAGYYVQSYTSGAWKTITTVATNSATVSAKANTAYSFRVIAYSTNAAGTRYNGTASSVVAARTSPDKPASFAKKSVTASTATLSWKAVSGATGYAIEQYTGSTWKAIATTKSTSYTVSKLSANTAYKFRIRAYVTVSGKTYYSAYTSTVTATTLLAAPKSLAVSSATATSLKVSWKKATGAKKYQVYYSTDGKKWKRATTTSKTSYTISNLKANTKYQIKVRAYNSSSVYGDYTSVLTTYTAPSKVVLSSLKAGSKKITVTWKKVSGVTGYEVDYSTSSSFSKSKTKTVTIKKSSTVKTTIKKLTKGKKYYIRVRAYKTVNGKNLYGKYCEYEVIKAK